MNATAFYSNYDYLLEFKAPNGQSFRWNSNVINYSLKNDFTYFYNSRNTMRFGAQALLFDFLPYKATGSTSGIETKFVADKRYGVEYSAYFGNEHKLTQNLTAEYGLRISYYTYVGKGKAYYFRNK